MLPPENLPQNARLFQHLFDQALLGIAVEDLEGKLLLANPALCSILGYTSDELCRMSCSQFASEQDSEDDWAQFQKLRSGDIDHYALDKRYTKKDGSYVWGRLNVSLLKSENEGPPLVFALVEDITKRKQAEEALSAVSRKLIQAQEQERARIARDLHDNVSQRIALIAMRLEQFQSQIRDVEVHNGMDELRKDTLDVASELQALSHELHSPKLDNLGLLAAMKGFCREFSNQHKVEVDFSQNDVPRILPPEISLSLFRVLQEALHNAFKHSGVRHFEVRVRCVEDSAELTVSDSGAGFDPNGIRHQAGLGLVSMQERMQLVQGTLTIESQLNRGTTVRARVPMFTEQNSVRAAG